MAQSMGKLRLFWIVEMKLWPNTHVKMDSNWLEIKTELVSNLTVHG